MIFKWIQTYRKIFKSALVCVPLMEKLLTASVCLDVCTVNSLISGHGNQGTALINGQIHFPRRIASQSLIIDSLKSGQPISRPSFQQTHFHSEMNIFPFLSLYLADKEKKLQLFSFQFLFNFKQRFFILCSSFKSSWILDFIHSMAFSCPLNVIQVLMIPTLVLNFRIQHPRKLEPLKYPSLGHKRSKI